MPATCRWTRSPASRVLTDKRAALAPAAPLVDGHPCTHSQADSQPLLDSQSTIVHGLTVPHLCQNGERIGGSHGHTRTIALGPDLGRSRSEAGGNDLLSNHSPDRHASARVAE